jgi:hypothetical protein
LGDPSLDVIRLRGAFRYRPLFNRGNCLRKMGRVAESITDLKAAVELEASAQPGAVLGSRPSK